MTRAGFVLTLCAVASFALPSSAQPKPAKPPAAARPRASASAIESVARALVVGLGALPPDVRIASAPLVADSDVPRRDALVSRIATQLASFAATSAPESRLLTLPEARALAGRAPLLYVATEIAKGELRVTADVHPVAGNAWDRLRGRVPAPTAHAYASAPLDAEVRSYMTPIVLEKAATHRAKHGEAEVLALGCGDVDGDGGLELVIVSRANVLIGRIRGDRVVTVRSAPWSGIAPRAATPLREPLASVVVSPPEHPGEIWIGSTERASVVLDETLGTKRALAGLPLPGGACAVPAPESNALDGALVACDAKPGASPAPHSTLTDARVDVAALPTFRAPDGRAVLLAVARVPGGRLRVGPEGGAAEATRTFEGVGADVAVADLDLDGRPEIAFSAERGDESITIATLTDAGLERRVSLHADEPVRALAACPPEEHGVPALVAAVGTEVWLVR